MPASKKRTRKIIEQWTQKKKPRSHARNRPRHRISLNPLSAPKRYDFMRSYGYNVSIGVADEPNHVFMNADNKAMVVKLRVKVDKLPAISEFTNLFNQYKVTSVKHTLIPYFKDNVPFIMGNTAVANDWGKAVPNYQIYYMAENYSISLPNMQAKTMEEIDEHINQSQKRAYRMFPSKQKTLMNKRPSVPDVIYEAKAGALAPGQMVPAPWMDSSVVTNEIYGLQLVIFRVDRQVLNAHQSHSTVFQNMGWRINNDVYFQTRKVQ